MTYKILFITIFTALSLAQAETQGTVVKKDLSGYDTMDMNQFNQVQQTTKKSNIFKVTCKTDDNQEIAPEHPQYQSCMERAQQKALENKAKK
jgi:hypothetical protein